MGIGDFVQHGYKDILPATFAVFKALKEFLKGNIPLQAAFINFKCYAPVVRRKAVKLDGSYTVNADFPLIGQNRKLLRPWTRLRDEKGAAGPPRFYAFFNGVKTCQIDQR